MKIAEGISLQVFLFGAGLSLVFGLIHLLRGSRDENRNLSFLLLCISLLQFQIWAFLSGAYSGYPRLLSFYVTALYLAVIFAFRAYYFVIYPPESLDPRWRWLLLPLVFLLPLDLYFIFLQPRGPLPLLLNVPGESTGMVIFMRSLFIFFLMVMIPLFSSLALRMLRHYRAGMRQRVVIVNLLYILFTMISASAVMAGYIAGSQSTVRWGSAGISLLFIASCIIGIRYPNLIQLIICELQQKGNLGDVLNGIDVESLSVHLHRLMAEEAFYADESVSLQQVAQSLSVTPHQLSQLINRKYNTNFNTFINRYRIEEAQKRLLEYPKQSVLSIAFEVGFNSKSAFYEAFSRIAGMTPREFRQHNQ